MTSFNVYKTSIRCLHRIDDLQTLKRRHVSAGKQKYSEATTGGVL